MELRVVLRGPMVAPRQQDQLARLAAPARRAPRTTPRESGRRRGRGSGAAAWSPSARPPRAGRARRARPRAPRCAGVDPHLERAGAKPPQRDGRLPPGRSRSRRRSHSSVAAAWIAMKPPMLEPRTQTLSASTPSRPAQEARHRADVGQRRGAHPVLGFAVTALVEGERRPAARRAGAAEVAVVLLARPRSVDDHHPRPRRRRLREPEQVGPARVHPGSARLAGDGPAHRLAQATRRSARPVEPAAPSEWTAAMSRHQPRDRSVEGSPVYPAGSRVNDRGHLEVGGCDVVELAAEFGTPVVHLRRGRHPRPGARLSRRLPARAPTTSRSCTRARPRRSRRSTGCFAEQGLSVDVASGGELHMALRAGFDPARIYMHGNNKTEAELRYAVEAGVGHVIVDSFARDRPPRRDAGPPPGRPDPGHARHPALHPLLRADRRPRLEVRLRPRGRAGGPGDRRGAGRRDTCDWSACTPTSARRSSSSSRTRRRSRRSPGSWTASWECRILNVGGGLGIAYTVGGSSRRRSTAYVDVKVRGVRARLRPGAADPDRAGALAGRQRRRHRV